MPDFLKNFDGSSRIPRDVQVEALNWISENWASKVLCLSLSVAVGKSALAKAISKEVGAHIITPSNILINQYSDTYPADNFLKGKIHYTCSSGISCHDWTNVCAQAACPDCPYVASKTRAMTEPTTFNPMSLYYATSDFRWTNPRTLIVDEAHQLGSMLLMLSGFSIGYSAHRFPKNCTNELVLITWLDDQIKLLGKQLSLYRKDKAKLSKLSNELASFKLVKDGVAEDPQNYAIWTNKGTLRGRPELFLNVKPLTPPRNLVNKLLASRNLILMSGTLFPTDIRDLLGDVPYKLLDLPSPIPKERRPVFVKPVPYPMNRFTDPARIAASIEEVIALHPGENVIIHVTYSLSEQLRKHFTQPILFNDKSNKDEVLEQFKKRGGIFLAAGCAEGIDLKGDLCRVNIIPKMPYPNLGDPMVAKRKTLVDGETWYTNCIMKTIVQQVGRSTRTEDDWSASYILDPNFERKFKECKSALPKSFVESVVGC